MNDINYIVPGLESCNRKCRKCRWRDGFSGECMLMARAAEYIKRLESDNSEKIVYCKDCIYCEMKTRTYMYHGTDKYICKHCDGLPALAELNPMDYCSRGKAKKCGFVVRKDEIGTECYKCGRMIEEEQE